MDWTCRGRALHRVHLEDQPRQGCGFLSWPQEVLAQVAGRQACPSAAIVGEKRWNRRGGVGVVLSRLPGSCDCAGRGQESPIARWVVREGEVPAAVLFGRVAAGHEEKKQ